MPSEPSPIEIARRFHRLPLPVKLSRWQTFRTALGELDDETALRETTFLFAHADWTHWLLDPDDCSAWPTPWELLAEPSLCDVARAAMVLATIEMSPLTGGWTLWRLSNPQTRTGSWAVGRGKLAIDVIENENLVPPGARGIRWDAARGRWLDDRD